MTYHDSDTHTGTASTAKAEEAGAAPAIEITPAMIDAGVAALHAYNSDLETPWNAVKRIYCVMRAKEDLACRDEA